MHGSQIGSRAPLSSDVDGTVNGLKEKIRRQQMQGPVANMKGPSLITA